jgi:hypothetical protein
MLYLIWIAIFYAVFLSVAVTLQPEGGGNASLGLRCRNRTITVAAATIVDNGPAFVSHVILAALGIDLSAVMAGHRAGHP